MSMPRLRFTNAGRELQLKGLDGAQLQFTRIVMGDGELTTQSPATLTAVIHEILSVSITRKKRTGNYLTVGGPVDFGQMAAGAYARELAVYAMDPDVGEIAYCYGNAFGEADYIDPAISVERLLTVGVVVGDVENIDLTLDESLVWATKQELDTLQETIEQNLQPKLEELARRRVYMAGSKAPTDTSLLWVDTTPTTGGLKYYDGSTWAVVPVAYS